MISWACTTLSTARIVTPGVLFPVARQAYLDEAGRNVEPAHKALSDNPLSIRWLRSSVANGAVADLDAPQLLAINEGMQHRARFLITRATLFRTVDAAQADAGTLVSRSAKHNII